MLASAVSFWSFNSLRTSPAVKSPFSTAAKISSLPNAFLASSLFVILASASISFSNWSNASLRAVLVSASSFLSSSTFAFAFSASALAVANSVSASVLALSASS